MAYRLAEEPPHLLVLQALHAVGWIDLYAFSMEPQLPIDYVVANHYTSTHPQSQFVRFPTVQLPGREVRKILRGHEYVELRASGSERTIIDGDETLLGAAREVVRARVPPGHVVHRRPVMSDDPIGTQTSFVGPAEEFE